MSTSEDQVAHLEAAIAALERLRPTAGDAVVDAALAPLRQQLSEGELAKRALAGFQSYLPEELAAKARAAQWIEGERRQVTVLFADLSGFTAISERADPEIIRAFQHDLFRELARIIYQYEGFVEKFVGDAVLAIFGAPLAHEDDAERALRVALAMRERMAALNRRWADRLGAPVTLHVGVNTGDVVAGEIGSGLAGGTAAAYAVTGDTVNTTSRLQDAARPGQILVSRTTYRLAQGAFTFEAHEPVQVKNKRDPLAVYELLRARPLPGKVRGLPGMGEPFVGRDADVKLLSTVLDGLTSPGGGNGSGGHIVVITGDAGIGKSRLVAELQKQAGARVLWLEGRCFPHTSTLSYGPVLDMLRRFAGIVDDDTERRARKRLDTAVEQLFPGDADALAVFANLLAMRLSRKETAYLNSLPARDLSERVFLLVQELLKNLVHDRPLVLFLEDMHWVDFSTIDLIEKLLYLTDSEPLLMVVAARPEQEDSPLSRLRQTLARPEYHERTSLITLDSLDQANSLDMIRELLRIDELPPRLGDLVVTKAEGNPFFVEEIIRALIERGALTHDENGWAATPLLEQVTATIPDTLQGLIMARIDRLPDETKYVVQHAAVIGRTFLYRVLLEIAEHSPSLDADLSHLERTALIRERSRDPEVEYTFQHALTQDMAYQTLLKTRSRDLHKRVGEAMERIFAGRLGEFYSIVAEHFDKGEVWDKAADYHVKAADHASQLFAAEARIQYRQGLDALEQMRVNGETRRRRVDVTIALTREALLGSAPGAAAVAECTQRLHIAESLAAALTSASKRPSVDDRMRIARVHAWLGRAYARQDVGRMSEYFDRVLDVANEVHDPELAAFIGQVLLNQGHFAKAESMLAPAVGALQERGSWLEWVTANGSLAMAAAAQGNCREGLRLARLGVARSRNLQGLTLIVMANSYLTFTHLLCDETEQAVEISRDNLPLASRTDNQLMEAVALTAATWAATRAGQLDEAKKTLEQFATAFDHPVLFDWRCAIKAELAYAQGDHQSACELAEEAVNKARARNGIYAEAHAERIWAHALAAQDSAHPDVEKHMHQSREQFRKGSCEAEVSRTNDMWDTLRVKRGDHSSR